MIRRRLPNRGAELEQALATILFVDIVQSTEKAARLGDSRWTQVMNHYYAAVRKELKSLRGKEIVTTGHGVLATFDAPASGVRCATAIREAVRTLGLEIRGRAARRRIQSEWGRRGRSRVSRRRAFVRQRRQELLDAIVIENEQWNYATHFAVLD